MVVTFLLALLAWIVISVGAGVGLGRMIARAETEDGRVHPSPVGKRRPPPRTSDFTRSDHARRVCPTCLS